LARVLEEKTKSSLGINCEKKEAVSWLSIVGVCEKNIKRIPVLGKNKLIDGC
jgi:hypothetical protein